MLSVPTRLTQRAATLGLGLLLLVSAHASAQDPIYVPVDPQWGIDAGTGSMVLQPPTAKLALGLSSAHSTLQVLGEDVTSTPGSGYAVLGPTNGLHMQLDRNDIRVSGPTNSTFGSLYLQRYGGPIVVHGSRELEDRVYITSSGDLGVGTADPLAFGIDRKLLSLSWPNPPTAIIAVDGDVLADQIRSRKLKVLDLIRVGRPGSPTMPGTTWDKLHTDAILQVGGKLSAQSIVVHLNSWADDVFDDDYPLTPLDDLAEYIERERHLPDVPAESEVLAEGLDVAQTNEILLRKIEELTLHTIAQQKQIEELERKIDALAR